MTSISVPTTLLAKRPSHCKCPSESETLIGHATIVLGTAKVLLEVIGIHSLKALGLDPVAWFDDMRASVLRGAFLHDLGKANNQFQRLLLSGGKAQDLRHEWLSAWLPLKHRAFFNWLFSDSRELIVYAVLDSVLGHHLKAADGASITNRFCSGDSTVNLLLDHTDINRLLTSAGTMMGLHTPPFLENIEIDLSGNPLRELRSWLPQALGWHQNTSDDNRRFVALVKALVIAADVAGSAVPKYNRDPLAWTRIVLTRCCRPEELTRIVMDRLKGQSVRPFQQRVGGSCCRLVYVKAGCGSGKTVAAYLWAAQHARARKLFVCYPTTGTATEGFRDYIIPSEMTANAALLHSRAECDLEEIMSAEDESIETIDRIDALATWDVPVSLCTADQVLGIIQNNRRALFAFPAIANAAFVFDEIHQYDDRMFAALLRFLKAFRGVPVLLMTASLPRNRLDALQETTESFGNGLEVIEGPRELEEMKRYVLEGPTDAIPWDRIERAIEEDEKILWVVNTVDRCHRLAQEATDKGFQPLLYHSRYRYLDRIKRHNAVIGAFRVPGPTLAITTQVCEVSLDISADLLITDLAPIPALIQRLGRLNRRVNAGKENLSKPAVIIEPESPSKSLPSFYRPEDLDAARIWISRLGTDALSQQNLSSVFEELAASARVQNVTSAWLDGGPFSAPASLREAGVTIPVVMEEDLTCCMDERGKPSVKQISRYTIPMILGPVSREISKWRRLGSSFIAPTERINYSEMWGAKWEQG